MNTITNQLQMIASSKRLGIMTHAVIGFPSLEATRSICLQMVRAGVDFIELQIPFSDPAADGPVIMSACETSLAAGISLENCFQFIQQLTKDVPVPILCMTYFQVIFAYGIENFLVQAQQVGAQGLIVPDLPPDEQESRYFALQCAKLGIHNIRVLSPSSTNDRIALNATDQSGFLYCTSRNGTTGIQQKLDPKLGQFLDRVRRLSAIPIAVGFGIKDAKQLEILKNKANLAVIGSSIIEQINANGIESVQDYLTNLIVYTN